MRYGIALSGGGTRGAAHVGVLCALEDNGLLPSAVSGTSAGSIVAGLYALGIPPHVMKEYVIQLAEEGKYLIDADYLGIILSLFQFFTRKTISFSGLIKGKKLEDYLEKLTEGRNIREVQMKTVITAVDLCSNQTIAYINSFSGIREINNVIWKTDIKLSEAMHASCAVPAVFQPKNIGNMCLVDGGVTDVVPVDLLIAAGEPNVLGVDLSENYPFHERDNIIEISSHSLAIMMSRLSGYRTAGEKLMLRPALPESAGLLTFKEMINCMNAGYDAAKAMLPAIRQAFS
jgi:NTE family protein